MESSRRQQAQNDLGMNFEREDKKRETALAKESERVAQKEAKRQMMMERSSYRMMASTAKYMDKYFLDPIIGFFIPGIGDVLTSMLALPFVYYSLFVVKSIPLTLAVIYNILMDTMIGCVPWVGDILDIFKRSYVDNLRLITGYIEDDKEIINKVRKKAFITAIFIVILCFAIYGLVRLAMWIGTGLFNFIARIL